MKLKTNDMLIFDESSVIRYLTPKSSNRRGLNRFNLNQTNTPNESSTFDIRYQV
jgi:hypothetical protein